MERGLNAPLKGPSGPPIEVIKLCSDIVHLYLAIFIEIEVNHIVMCTPATSGRAEPMLHKHGTAIGWQSDTEPVLG
jgi:hypothetical protein